MEHSTQLSTNLIHTVYAYLPTAYPSNDRIRLSHTAPPRIHGYQPPSNTTLPPHTRDTLPDKQCVPPVFSHQRITIATGNSPSAIRKYSKPSSRRKIPDHLTPHISIDSLLSYSHCRDAPVVPGYERMEVMLRYRHFTCELLNHLSSNLRIYISKRMN